MKITAAQARAFQLNRQGLGRRTADPIDVIGSLLAVQTQYASTLTVSTALRARPHPVVEVAEQLKPGGQLVKGWTVRSTLHTMREAEFELLHSAIGDYKFQRLRKGMMRWIGLTAEQYDAMQDEVRAALESGPLTRPELHAKVKSLQGIPGAGWGWDVMGLSFRGLVTMCSHTGATTFALREPPIKRDVFDARIELLRRYLQAYAPATIADFHWWSSLPMKEVKTLFDQLKAEIAWVELDGQGPFAILVEDIGKLEPGEVIPDVALTAKFDVYTLARKDRSWVIAPGKEALVFRKAGQVEACVLVYGEAQGTWRMKASATALKATIERWPSRWPKAVERGIECDLHAVAQSLGLSRVEWEIQAT